MCVHPPPPPSLPFFFFPRLLFCSVQCLAREFSGHFFLAFSPPCLQLAEVFAAVSGAAVLCACAPLCRHACLHVCIRVCARVPPGGAASLCTHSSSSAPLFSAAPSRLPHGCLLAKHNDERQRSGERQYAHVHQQEKRPCAHKKVLTLAYWLGRVLGGTTGIRLRAVRGTGGAACARMPSGLLLL